MPAHSSGLNFASHAPEYANEKPLHTEYIRVGGTMYDEFAVRIELPPDPSREGYAKAGGTILYMLRGFYDGESRALANELGVEFKTDSIPTTYGGIKPRGVRVMFHKPGTYLLDGKKLSIR